jgi:hypothetical protein
MRTERVVVKLDDAKKEARDTASNVLKKFLSNNRDGLLKVVHDKNHMQYNLIKELLIKSLCESETSEVSKQEEDKLPEALYTVLADHHNPQGLFEKARTVRGPGSKLMSHPYELLSSAALIKKEATSSLGKKLKIYSTDKLDFGQKFANDNALSTKGGTFEADILLHRNLKVIGIDAKYTKHEYFKKQYGEYSTEHELMGIQKGLEDGQIHEFYFVSNTKFHYLFRELVEDYNQKIFESRIEELQAENDLPPKNELYIDFKKDKEKVNKLIREHNVPQIGMCENVNYEES